jgi:hypothetical protein
MSRATGWPLGFKGFGFAVSRVVTLHLANVRLLRLVVKLTRLRAHILAGEPAARGHN